MQTLRKAAIPLFLLLSVTALLVSGDALTAALYRNLGHLSLLAGFGPCDDGLPSPAVHYLERAVRLHSNSASAWRNLLRVKGWSDRQWIREALGASPPGWVDRAALLGAAETLRPPAWAMEQPWTEERCRAAWDSWTLGLVWALDGRWSQAAAAYQAGLGLAPGRVPSEIVREYYLVLARHVLSAPGLSAGDSLAAAKYLALSGQGTEAAVYFRALLAGATLDPEQACQAERWLAWEGGGSLPPDPVACRSAQDDAGLQPAWVLPLQSTVGGQAAPSLDPASGRVLLGFDLDPDILEGGAEVLGTFHWREQDGRLSLEGFRQPNLWPNSGNSWLGLEGFSSCLPGYTEPPWVSPCASSLAARSTKGRPLNLVGHVAVPSAEGPDILLATASAGIPADLPILYGGWWRVSGELPQAHVARYGGDRSDPRGYYEKVIDLAHLSQGEWQPGAGISPGLPWAKEFNGWIRPETDLGQGALEFDDLFCFVGPSLQ